MTYNNGAEAAIAAPIQTAADGGRYDMETPTDRTTRPLSYYAPNFWAKVNRTETCWLWAATTYGNGYGWFWAGRAVKAHRYSYELANGLITNSLFVLHKCDTPLCVNPAHLYLGTQQENMWDRDAKKRGNPCHGEKHWNRKFSLQRVQEIRRMWESGEWKTQKELAKHLGIPAPTLNRAINKPTWEELDEAEKAAAALP